MTQTAFVEPYPTGTRTRYAALRPDLIENLLKISNLATDQALARACNISPTDMSRVRRSPYNPPWRVVAGIASAFNLSPGEIVTIIPPPEPEPEPEPAPADLPEFLK